VAVAVAGTGGGSGLDVLRQEQQTDAGQIWPSARSGTRTCKVLRTHSGLELDPVAPHGTLFLFTDPLQEAALAFDGSGRSDVVSQTRHKDPVHP
jgi:hypothetical protein